jgi:predicted nuclease of predicted toxin-antitoxin system
MTFLIDAQLPRRLAYWLRNAGYEAIHTLDLPGSNRTQDEQINRLSLEQQWIVITKDKDFVNSFLIRGQPDKLLLLATGNITNSELEKLFLNHFDEIASLFESHRFIELNRTMIVIHQ